MDSKNVTAAKPKKGGAVFKAPKGTALPTSPSEALNAAFKSLGYVSEDGLTNENSPDSDKEKAWGGDVVLNFMNERPDTFKFKLIEATNPEVLKAVYGDSNVTGNMTNGITVHVTSEDPQEYAWIFDMTLKDGGVKRIVVPQAKMTELGEIAYVDNKSVGYEITISATPDADGNYHHEYIGPAVAAQQ